MGSHDDQSSHNLDFQTPLRTSGRYIVDAAGKRVKLASVNWYGASDIYFVAGGLDFRHRTEIAATIKRLGFNSVRFPYSDELVVRNPVIPPELLSANLDLLDAYDLNHSDASRHKDKVHGPRAMDVFVACVEAMTDAGLMVIVNDHITNAQWCDGFDFSDSMWKNDHMGPLCRVPQTTSQWIDNWKTIMKPFISNPLVIGADLRNEPRGIYCPWSTWAPAAEEASEALLEMQPNWLMFVEGIASANDCSGAHKRPIKLSIPDRVVYSSHVYAWSGWGKIRWDGPQKYSKRTYESFSEAMDHKWGFLLNDNIAPVWAGEFGISSGADAGDRNYWTNLMRYLREKDVDFGYWALNPRQPDLYEHECYGLLCDDWETPREGDFRLPDLQDLAQGR
ncbi:glycoside hydrolase family 5 protein [Dissoconium aciculare CBS 342.82]|uniref:Glycoside hydrolase family 5 protein n=1 Tax=Dissoconium aciculare CBS 342.82 TaxID=1314786 RepID=A0A6J3MJV1_9PEZI|nr:glycoside hydrolase family 5 protein [Dissoconium aciculare CBS 342.82]KAF1827222.1 glycoside hydrolase family 5 protein [Dissoconium aciculare CBS 342.82]